MNENPQFGWSDAFLLGFGPMDASHQEFVSITHALLTCPDTDLMHHLQEMDRHTEEHFSQELGWMQSTDFPAMVCHADEHRAVQKSLREVMDRVGQGNHAVGRSLAQALADWFPGHVDYLDAALAQWMVKRQTGGIPVVLRRAAPSLPGLRDG